MLGQLVSGMFMELNQSIRGARYTAQREDASTVDGVTEIYWQFSMLPVKP